MIITCQSSHLVQKAYDNKDVIIYNSDHSLFSNKFEEEDIGINCWQLKSIVYVKCLDRHLKNSIKPRKTIKNLDKNLIKKNASKASLG